MSNTKGNCPICGAELIDKKVNYILNFRLTDYECVNCGCFTAPFSPLSSPLSDSNMTGKVFDKDKLKSYLFYHTTNLQPILCYEKEYKIIIPDDRTATTYQIYNLTPEMVENWYPNTFEERINYALLYLAEHSGYVGEAVEIPLNSISRLFFLKNNLGSKEFNEELRFILKYLYNQELVENIFDKEGIANFFANINVKNKAPLKLSAKAWGIVYELQSKHSNNKNVFVAMKFGPETQNLREKIKEGLAGYNVRIMDEIEHNHQIVPEMLYEIKNSRFVVAELSNHNNGAYYEAGYALGLGKEVIHICSEKELKSGLHFDVAQVNTITYDAIDEIPEKLKKRIEATIESK